MKEILLTQGKVALVDDEDFERIASHRWYAHREGNTFYAHRKSDGKTIRMHREILLLRQRGRTEVDHKDGNGLNNKKSNLRICTHSENIRNSRKQSNNTSGIIGVSRQADKWIARIKVKSQCIYLGIFSTKEEAALSRRMAVEKYFGDYRQRDGGG